MRFPRAFLSLISAAAVSTALITPSAYASETVEAAEASEAIAKAGKAIFTGDGKKLGSIYKVAPDGGAQVLLDGRLFTIPVDSLSLDDGKIVTSLTKRDIISSRR